MISSDDTRAVVAPWAAATEDWTEIAASSSGELIALVRRSISEGTNPSAIVARPDNAVVAPDDHEEWLALASVLVAEGVGALHTRHVRSARRLFHTQHAILLGGEMP